LVFHSSAKGSHVLSP